jgi:hypothetical protein
LALCDRSKKNCVIYPNFLAFLNLNEAKNCKFGGLLDANHYEIPRVVEEKLEENKKGK